MADEAKAKGNEALKSGLSDAGRALSRVSFRSRAGPGASTFGDAFGPEMWVRLASDPNTRGFLQQPDFVKMMQDLQKNPNNLNLYLKDQRVMQALGALLNLKFQTRGPEEDSEAQSPSDSGSASGGGLPERKRPEPEPMEVAEEKEKTDRKAQAQKEKEAGNAAYKKDFEIAIQHYSKAIDLDDEDISFLTNRAAVYLEMGKFEECIKDCDKAVERGRELTSDFKMIARALTRKGTALVKMAKVSKDYDLAIEAFKKALSEHRNPDTLQKLNEAEKAKRDLEQQEYFNPQITDEEPEKSNQYFKEQKYPEAVKHYSEAIKKNPKDPKMTDTIIMSETSSQSKEFNPNSRVICRVCEKQFTLYTCPRCNIRYCSLQCYKSHSLHCTESFMRENVVEELQQIQSDEASKRKMLDILKRFHEEVETTSMDEDELGSSLSEETIQKILSGDQISFDDLSAEEKKHFQRALASGELSKMIEPWDPWWLKPSAKYISLSSDGTQLVQPMVKQESVASSENDSDNDQWHDIPSGPETPIPPVGKLTAFEPSPLLTIHIVDIIYSYCFTLRLYNGDWKSDPIESALVSLSISSVLDQHAQPETVFEALLHCLEPTCSSSYKHMGGLSFGLTVIDDVTSLLYLGGAALVCLLYDLQKMIQTAEKELKSENLHKSKRTELKSKFKSAERKIHFIMCWVHEQPAEALSTLAAIVNAEKSSAMEYADSKRGIVRMEGRMERRGKPLIKEVQSCDDQ